MPPRDPAFPDRRRLSVRPVSLPSQEDLAHTALETRPLRDALNLARWCGPSTPVGLRGLPGIDNAHDAIRTCGLWPSGLEENPAELRMWLGRLSSVSDIEEFRLPWETAIRLGLVELDTHDAWPVRGLEGQARVPERILGWWTHVFEDCVERAQCRLPQPDIEFLPQALRLLYEAPNGVRTSLCTLTQDVLSALGTSAVPPQPHPQAVDRLLHTLWHLTGTGAVVVGRHGPEAADDPRPFWVRLTDLGRFGVRRILLDVGVSAPLVEELTDAAELLDLLGPASPESRLCAFDAWFDARTPARALQEIAAATRGPHRALRRWTGTKVLNTTSSQLVPELHALLYSDDPTVVSLAANVLLSSGMLPQHDIDRIMSEYGAWVVIDMYAAALSSNGADGDAFLAEDSTESIKLMILGNIDRLRENEHPDTVQVLEAIGHQHPDPDVAAGARDALRRLSSPH